MPQEKIPPACSEQEAGGRRHGLLPLKGIEPQMFDHPALRQAQYRLVIPVQQLALLTFRGPYIVIYSYNKSQRDALFLRLV